jgi:transmembrane sensor
MSDNIPWILIQKSFKKQLNDDDRSELENWLSASEPNQKLYRQLQMSWNLAGGQQSAFHPDENAAWKKIIRSANIDWMDRQTVRKERRRRILYFVRNAAAILLLPVLIITALLFIDRTVDTESAIVQVATQTGQRSDFIMDNGTRVWLNSGSQLSYGPGQRRGETRLLLEGEAYVDVPAGQKTSMVIATSHMDVRVTGTSFNVRAYPDEATVETVLESGEVELLAAGPDGGYELLAVLQPNQRAVYHKGDERLETGEITTFEYTAWRDGILVFRSVTFDELVHRLEKWYDVDITYDARRFEGERYSGVFRNRETLEQVLESIRLTTPFEYTMDNNHLIIE